MWVKSRGTGQGTRWEQVKGRGSLPGRVGGEPSDLTAGVVLSGQPAAHSIHLRDPGGGAAVQGEPDLLRNTEPALTGHRGPSPSCHMTRINLNSDLRSGSTAEVPTRAPFVSGLRGRVFSCPYNFLSQAHPNKFLKTFGCTDHKVELN